jgi:hypothetical protein
VPFQKLYPDRPPRKRPVIPRARDVDLTGRRFASPPEAAAVLNRSLVTLERWRKNGKGPPFVRFSGRKIEYPVPELMTWKPDSEERP